MLYKCSSNYGSGYCVPGEGDQAAHRTNNYVVMGSCQDWRRRVNKQGPTEGEGGGAGEERADELAVLRNPPGLAACPRAVAAEEPSVRVSDSVVYPGERRCGRARARFDLKSSQSIPLPPAPWPSPLPACQPPPPVRARFIKKIWKRKRHTDMQREKEEGRQGGRETEKMSRRARHLVPAFGPPFARAHVPCPRGPPRLLVMGIPSKGRWTGGAEKSIMTAPSPTRSWCLHTYIASRVTWR